MMVESFGSDSFPPVRAKKVKKHDEDEDEDGEDEDDEDEDEKPQKGKRKKPATKTKAKAKLTKQSKKGAAASASSSAAATAAAAAVAAASAAPSLPAIFAFLRTTIQLLEGRLSNQIGASGGYHSESVIKDETRLAQLERHDEVAEAIERERKKALEESGVAEEDDPTTAELIHANLQLPFKFIPISFIRVRLPQLYPVSQLTSMTEVSLAHVHPNQSMIVCPQEHQHCRLANEIELRIATMKLLGALARCELSGPMIQAALQGLDSKGERAPGGNLRNLLDVYAPIPVFKQPLATLLQKMDSTSATAAATSAQPTIARGKAGKR